MHRVLTCVLTALAGRCGTHGVGGTMIRPGKLNAGSVAYYEQSVERQPVEVGTDMTDYYSEHGDRPPTAVVAGRGVDDVAAAVSRLGVEAGQVVDRDQVEAWFNGCRGPSGEQLGKAYQPAGTRTVTVKDAAGKPVLDDAGDPVTRPESHGGSVRGWDLMTAAPKSVSMLWGLGDDATRATVERAHLAASGASLGYLARHAGYTRQRMPGYEQPVVVESGALVGVRYQHRTSRAGEPHLHDHVLIHNRVLNSVTGEWTSLDGTSLMYETKTAGTIYQAVLRSYLTHELGLSWRPIDPNSGVADLTGLSREQIEAWSTRTSEIDTWMADHGLTGAAADAAAQKQTRDAKDTSRSDVQLRAEWMTRAANEGIDVAAIGRGDPNPPAPPDRGGRGGPSSPPPGSPPPTLPTPGEVLAAASRARSTFTRSQMTAAAAALLPPALVPPDQVDDLVEVLINETVADAVRLEAPAVQGDDVSRRARDGRLFGTREGSIRYATVQTIQLEREATDRAAARSPDLASDPAMVRAGGGLSIDQVAAVRTLVGSDQRATVLIAPAGAGKTTSLRVARAVWEGDGRTVRAIAPTGKAAAGLVDEGAAGAADTIATILGRVRRGAGTGWREGDVVLVDEAGMVGSLTLATLLEHAERTGAQLVLVGDPEQLQPVGEAAGLFELLADDLPDVARLGEVWRQVDPAERAATLGLRGDASDAETDLAIDWYARNDRVRAGDQATMLDEALTDWQTSTDHGQEAVILAPTWRYADALAGAAQQHQLTAGRVDHQRTVALGDVDEHGQRRGTGRVAGVGDLVMTRANDYTLRTSTGGVVRNGQTWTITQISTGFTTDTTRARVTLTRDHSREAAIVPASYLAQHARLGYAISIHQAQGITVDASYCILDGSTSSQNAAYTALTRGRTLNRAYIAAATTSGDEEHAPDPERFHATPDEAGELLHDIVERDRRDRAAHHVLGDHARTGRANQQQRFDPDTVNEFEQAARFTPAARTATAREIAAARAAAAATRRGLDALPRHDGGHPYIGI